MNLPPSSVNASTQRSAESDASIPAVNGVALLRPGESVEDDALRERAWAELLRKRAVARGLLAPNASPWAPTLGAPEHAAIKRLLELDVVTPVPTEQECRRHYEAHRARFTRGQRLHVKHILFAVTPRVDVHALARRAEQALLELLRPQTPPERFETMARELSNCPSGAQGGDLGWLEPGDCAPELANELFYQQDSQLGLGIHPRLIRTRFGLHIVKVVGRRAGVTPPFEEVRERIERDLNLRARTVALRHYLIRLAQEADVRGVDLGVKDGGLLQ